MEDQLIDYFAVIGVNKTAAEAVPDSVESHVSPVVLQRFPAEDFPDLPFPGGIEVLCQPQGWTVSHEPTEPTFFVFTLTDVSGRFSYCAVMKYYEILEALPVDMQTRHASVDTQSRRSFQSHISLESARSQEFDGVVSYAPKCLCLLSRHPLYGAFRTILCSIYSTMVTKPDSLPRLVAQVTNGLPIPPSVKSPLKVTLASDHKLHISAHDAWSPPFADGSVLLLFQLLGIRNVLRLVAALFAENKIVFLSSRLSHLQSASAALLGLLYPLQFSFPLIPVLPSTMDDFMCAPTPFIMGRLADIPLPESAEGDLVVADLDRGSVTLGEGIQDLATWGSVTEAFLIRACTMVLHPTWLTADNAFSSAVPVSTPEVQEVELRSVFLNLWIYWLWGYRSCLTVQRIHESFSVQFLPGEFIRLRHLDDDEVLKKVMESQALVSFIQDRGCPFRLCDFFDEAVAHEDQPVLTCSDEELRNKIHDLTGRFRSEERSCLSLPSNDVVGAVVFPNIVGAVEQWQDGYAQEAAKLRRQWKSQVLSPTTVPHGPKLHAPPVDEAIVAQDLLLLKSCFRAIFEDQAENEANAMVRSLVRAFRSPLVRSRLVDQLEEARKQHGTAITHEQFSVLSKLINQALHADTGPQSVGLAELLLQTVTSFHTKLPSGAEQCIYTTCQGNVVWKEVSFWSKAFHAAVEQHLVSMYLNMAPDEDRVSTLTGTEDSGYDVETPMDGKMTLKRSAIMLRRKSSEAAASSTKPRSGSGGESMRNTLTRNFRFPTASVITVDAELTPRNLSASSSPMELAAEQLRLWPHLNPARQEELSAMEEATVFAQAILFASRMVWLQLPMEVSDEKREVDSSRVISFVQRFFSGKSATLGISVEHSQILQDKIPKLVTMHREDLDSIVEAVAVFRSEEKERLFKPDLLDRETLYSENVHCYLLADGRDAGLGVLPDGPLLLPAEGALFISTYRIIFKGTPLDFAAGDGVITRVMPLAAILPPKRLSLTGLSFGCDGLLLQSTTFQVMRICFGSNVSAPEVDRIVRLLEQLRFPSTSDRLFCYSKDRPANNRMQHRGSSVDPESSIVPNDQLPKVFRRGERWTVANPDNSIEKEFSRLKLDVSGLGSGDTAGKWRMSLVNRTYRVCTTYPAALCVPASCTDEQVASVASHFQQDRFPVAVWRDESTAVAILRSGAPYRRTKEPVPVVNRRADSTSDVLATGADTAAARPTKGPPKVSSNDSLISADVVAYLQLCTSPRRRRHLSLSVLMQQPAVTNLQAGHVSKSVSQPASPATARRAAQERAGSTDSVMSADDVLKMKPPMQRCSEDVMSEAPDAECSPLYIIGSKPLSEDLVPLLSMQLVFVPVECPDVRAIRHSFRKLLRACAPPEPGSDSSHFYSAVEESGWMEQLQCIMRLAGAVVDLIDVQASPVLICLEDGWDVTAQVSSLAQLCLDGYYRTIDGFEILIEKEWLMLGHRFSRRGQHVEAGASDEFAPVFLQFLDAVHQLLLQFPLSFEFNHHFLEFIAYHQSALSYATFTLDSEIDRISLTTMDKDGRHRAGRSIWRHIRRQCSYSPVFCNLSFNATATKVLRPYSGISDLRLWQYYVRDSLVSSNRYDVEPESTPYPTRAVKDVEANGSQLGTNPLPYSSRSVLDLPVSNADALLMDHLSCLLCEHRRLSSLASDKASPWQKVWRTELAAARRVQSDERERELTLATSHSLRNHRRTSVEVLLKGKLTGQAQQAFSYPHRFAMHSFKTPTVCDSCKQVMWGVIRQGLQCSDCSYNSHYRCKLVAPSNCNEFKRGGGDEPAPVALKPAAALTRVTESLLAPLAFYPDGDPNTFRSRSASSTFYMTPAQERFHEGFLHKRGGIRKNWKMRWFVLNGEGMELCYYNAFQETHLRGSIDLEEVSEVNKASPVVGAPLQEGGAAGSFFEILTPKRTFLLMASNDDLRRKWMGAINGCIHLQRNLSSSSGL